MTHGGSRDGAGRPATQIDERRLQVLRDQKISFAEIGRRFGLHPTILIRAMKRIKNGQSK
jgi:IS30 family transposase